MSANTEQRKLAAIMFTDMVGYSALSQRNEALALELLEEHRRVVRGLLPRHSGREVKTTGDGFLLEFPSALAAVQGAVEIQNALHERNQISPPERQLRIRIGIHVGDVVMKDGDIHGDGVNIAARIEPLAAAGGICVSEDVEHQVRNKLAQPLTALGPTELKNIKLPVVVYRVVLPWESQSSSRGHEAQTPKSAIGNRQSEIKKSLATSAAVKWAALAALLLLAVGLYWRGTSPRGPTSLAPPTARRITSLAVLPFVNLSRDPEQEYFVDGVTELLCTDLSGLSALKRVPSRTTIMQYKGKTRRIPEIAAELGVDAIVEGSVQREGDLVVVSVQLIEGATDRHLWATNYERQVSSLLRLKTELSRNIAAEIKVQLTPQEETRLANVRIRSPEALANYFRGRELLNRQTLPDLTNSVSYFQKALESEPDFPEALAGTANAWVSLSSAFLAPRLAMPPARTNALAALRLDGNCAEAHFVLGYIMVNYDYDFAGAEGEFDRALAINPNYADAHDGRALVRQCQGRMAEAIAADEIAYQLDPLSMRIGANRISTYVVAGEFDRAIRVGKEVRKLQQAKLNLDNHMAATWLSFAYALAGDPQSAVAIMEPICGLQPQDRPPMVLAGLGYAQALADQKSAARRTVATLEQIANEQYVCVYEIAVVHVALGDQDLAFEWLYKALAMRADCIPYTKIDPRLKPLHPDKRFKQLLKDIGLEP